MTDGNFEDYVQIGFYEGPYGDPTNGGKGFEIITVDPPKCGRYFAMAKQAPGYAADMHQLEVTEIEIITIHT